jgi:organic radical activating enzyme
MLQEFSQENAVVARPYTLIVRVTERCEVGCNHCCINAIPTGAEMDLQLLEETLDGARESGVGLIHISGGEPLMHSEVERFVRSSSDRGLYVELTTSTYSKQGEDDSARLAGMKAAGLKRVMLSYDEAHAARVSIDHFARFVREAQSEDLEVCVVVVDWEGSAWPIERVKSECESRGVNGELVDWCRSNLSSVGRAARSYREKVSPSGKGARCPYVLTAPTLAPDGTVFLCPNLQSKSKLYQLGSVRTSPIGEILGDLQASSFYRALSALGPHGVAEVIGLTPDELPEDMCDCCQVVLKAAEDPDAYAKVENAISGDETVAVDLNALLPGHRRFVLGEERPQTGCLCG